MKFGGCLACGLDLETGDYHPACAVRLFGTTSPPHFDLSIEDLDPLGREIVNNRLSVTGVQKKLSLHMTPGTSVPGALGYGRLTLVGALGGTHILKPPSIEYPEMPQVEHLTMLLASQCGIRVAAHGLIAGSEGSLSYITKRFDRHKKSKVAVEDLCQLSELPTSNKYKSTVERAGQIVRRFSSNPGDDALRFFELIVFCFLTGNADMHLKNFSLMRSEDDLVSMTPAYDLVSTRLLISVNEDPEESAMPLNGKKSNLKKADFAALGSNLKLPEKVVDRTLERLRDTLPLWERAVDRAILSDEQKRNYVTLLRERVARSR